MAVSAYLELLAPHMTVSNIAAISAGLSFVYIVWHSIYNIYFHPLSSFPGPKRAAITSLFESSWSIGGKVPYIIKALHDEYGPVVRIAPNQLSFNSASSWKDIYGHVGGRKTFKKSSFYDDEGLPRNVVTSNNSAQHGLMRRAVSNGFSAKALAEQEVIVHAYIDKLIKQINTHATGKEGAEMVKWYNFATFDIIGDLAFGQPFGSLDDGKPHFWVSLIMESLKAGNLILQIRKWKVISSILMNFVPKSLMDARLNHIKYTADMTKKRLESKSTRRDLLSGFVAKETSQEMTIGEIESNASVLVIAGSETTATFLSGFSFYLLRNQDKYEKLTKEIRGAFKNYDEIDGIATDRLPYLKAVIEETLRIYPPVPIGLPRLSPGETVDGFYIPEGVEVLTSSYAATHSEVNFHRPDDFLPERWLDPDCTDKKHASQPFSLGSRVCLGRSLALLEMRLIVCKMLFSYDMELVRPEEDWVSKNKIYTLWNKPALDIKYTRRTGIALPPIDL